MKTSNTKTTILFGVLVALAAYVLLWRPITGDVSEAKARRTATEEALGRAQADLAAAQQEQAEAPVDPADEARLRAVPAEAEQAALLRNLDALADQSGLELATITPSEPTPSADGVGSTIQIIVTATGTREAAYGYIAGLAGLERLVVVEEVDLADQPDEDDATVDPLQVQLSLRAFVAGGSIPVVDEGAVGSD